MLELLLHLAAHVAGGVVHLADLGEQGGDLVAAQEAGCPPLQHVTQARLDGSWREEGNILNSQGPTSLDFQSLLDGTLCLCTRGLGG